MTERDGHRKTERESERQTYTEKGYIQRKKRVCETDRRTNETDGETDRQRRKREKQTNTFII